MGSQSAECGKWEILTFTADVAASSASVTEVAHPSHIIPSTFSAISNGSSSDVEALIVYRLATAGAEVEATRPWEPALRMEDDIYSVSGDPSFSRGRPLGRNT